MYNQTHLLTFLTVLQTNSFAGAAAELGYTASAVSQQIAALESSTRLTLFERSARAIHPTSAALQLAERSQVLLAEFRSLQESIEDIATGRRGRIRMGTVPSASAGLLPNALRRFTAEYLDTELLFEEDTTKRLVPALVAGDYDLIVISEHGEVRTEIGPEFQFLPLVRDRLLLLASSSREDGKTARDGLAAFADDVWAGPKPDLQSSAYFQQLCALAGFTPRIRYRSANFAVLNELARVGVAVTLLPVLGYQESADITAAPVEGVLARRRLSAAFRTSNKNPLLRPLVGALRAAGAETQARIDGVLAELAR